MARVAVTGGSGKLGRAVVTDLAAHGYDVLNLDRAAPPQGQPGDFVSTDLTDYGQVLGALTAVDERHQGVDAVVHLAAIPAPGLAPNAATFANNVLSSYHVFEAARAAGIRTVVWASSETVLGLPFDTPPPYVPVDEDYRGRPETTYSLGKAVEEEMAWHFCRWDPQASMVGLRFSNVMEPADYADFPSYEADPLHAQVEPVGLHRRPRRRAGGPPRPGARGARPRGVRDRERRHRDDDTVARAGRARVPRGGDPR